MPFSLPPPLHISEQDLPSEPHPPVDPSEFDTITTSSALGNSKGPSSDNKQTSKPLLDTLLKKNAKWRSVRSSHPLFSIRIGDVLCCLALSYFDMN